MGAGGFHAIGTSFLVQICIAMRVVPVYQFLNYCKALRTVLLKGDGNVTPWF